jgi:hypothetical protein
MSNQFFQTKPTTAERCGVSIPDRERITADGEVSTGGAYEGGWRPSGQISQSSTTRSEPKTVHLWHNQFRSSIVQMLNVSTFGAFIGFGIFGLGVHGFRYMQARILGGWNRARIIHDFFAKYRTLIREEKAPLWPLLLCMICIPLGIVIAFTSILLPF